ncbi:unnamed protein product [Dovyalis caffra]|uniref:Uncharacterized protein n=1 Tax=Dovyalis caffra TaxID=77055 RepID=A0AAV1RP34_9ROSI|nr:unnamed protein product [Dovyalis caffra]
MSVLLGTQDLKESKSPNRLGSPATTKSEKLKGWGLVHVILRSRIYPRRWAVGFKTRYCPLPMVPKGQVRGCQRLGQLRDESIKAELGRD